MGKGRRKRGRGGGASRRGGRAGGEGGGSGPDGGLTDGGLTDGGPADGGPADGGQRAERLKAPATEYADADGNVLSLRGSLSAKARAEYAQTLAGVGARPAASPEDRFQRAVELLFERLAVRWNIAGAPVESQRELLQRYRWASEEERAFVRAALREHCAEHFPDIQAP